MPYRTCVSGESLVAALNVGVEESLWGAVRALEEAEILLMELSRVHSHRADDGAGHVARATQARAQASAIRDVLNERSNLQAS